jgi:O-antigen/teichoic acid export membrane protein
VANDAHPPLSPAGPDPGPASPRTAFRSAVFTYSTQVVVAALSLLNVLVVARALGPAGRGDVVFLITVAVLSSQFASLSVGEAISIHAGREPERRAALASNAAILAGVLGLATVVAVVLLKIGIPGIGPHLSASLWALALASIAPLVLQEYLSRLTMAEYRFAVSNVSFVAPVVVQVVANLALYAAGELTVGRAMLAWVGGQLLSLAVVLVAVLRSGHGFGRPDRGLGRSMVGFGLKAHGSRSLQWSNYRLDQWLVGALAGSTELGLYSVAVAWAEGLFLLPQAIAIVQRPDLVRDDGNSAGRRAARGFRLVTLGTVPLVVGLLVLAPFLCQTIFGAEFGGSVEMLRILAVGGFGIVAMKLLGSALIAQRRPVLETIATASAFAATIVLDVLLIPRHGGVGAAVASTAAYSVGGLAVAVIAARSLRFPLRSLVPTLADIRSARGMLGVLRGRTA